MLTPVIKAKKGKQVVQFYSVKDYDKWKESHLGFSIKYYKGSGTSTPQEAREYFKEFKNVKYLTNDEENNDAIELAFSKNEDSANNRKVMLSEYM